MLVNWALNLTRNQPVLFGVGLAVGILAGAAILANLAHQPEKPALSRRNREDQKAFRREQTRAELEQLAKEVRNGR
jgi:hypothetical protein